MVNGFSVYLVFAGRMDVSGFLLRTVVNALLIYLMLSYLPGIFVDTLGGMLLAALVLGIVNGSMAIWLFPAGPVWRWRKLLPVTFCLNLAGIGLVVYAVPGFEISSLPLAGLGVFILSLCSSQVSRSIRAGKRRTGEMEPARKG